MAVAELPPGCPGSLATPPANPTITRRPQAQTGPMPTHGVPLANAGASATGDRMACRAALPPQPIGHLFPLAPKPTRLFASLQQFPLCRSATELRPIELAASTARVPEPSGNKLML